MIHDFLCVGVFYSLLLFYFFTAERFGKKLSELCLERGALKLGLPSRQPSVASFLQRLTQAVNSALQRTEHCQRRSGNHHRLWRDSPVVWWFSNYVM